MNIRRAQESDAPALAKVHVDSWQAAYRGLVPDSVLQGFTYQGRTERFWQSLATGSEETYLVEEDGSVMGFLVLGTCRDSDLNVDCTGEIWGIYISPDHWRKGLGKMLGPALVGEALKDRIGNQSTVSRVPRINVNFGQRWSITLLCTTYVHIGLFLLANGAEN